MKIKHFTLLLIGLQLFLLLGVAPGFCERLPAQTVPKLVGENLSYYMDFLVFKKLAAGRLQLAATEKPNVYRVELVGRTLGVASWLAGNRVQTYTTLMERTPDGFLQSIEHVSRIQKNALGTHKDRAKRYRYDYVNRTVTMEKARNGVYGQGKVVAFPEGVRPVDMLAAFYNLRAGHYGPLVSGAKYAVPTFSSDGFSDIGITVLTGKEQEKLGYFPPGGLLLQITLDPEVFDTNNGLVYVWFNRSGIVERGIVKDMIGLGDVRGYLAEVTP